MKYLRYGLIVVGVGSILLLALWFARGCNLAVQEAVVGIPGCSSVVDKIEQKIPPILGGKKKPKSKPKLNPGDKLGYPEDPRPSRFTVNPRLDLGIGMGTAMKPSRLDLVPKVGVGVSIFSYGKSKMDTKYRFLRVGIQTNMKEVEVTGAPIMVRLGSEKRPLLSNTYIYPYVGYNIQRGGPTVGVGISLSF